MAIGIALSPVPIIAVILMLFSPRARSNGPAFLLGWVVGVGAVAGIALAASDAGSVGTQATASDGASWGKVVLGVVLLAAAGRRWRKRPAPGADAPMPAWMAGIDAFTPAKAFGLAALLGGVNPKNLVLSAAAGASIAQADLSGGGQVVVLAVFVVLASLTVAIPVVYALVGGAGARATLDGWKAWLEHNNAAVMTVLFLVFGVVLISQSIQSA
ncbi:MAG: GAP family protein [Acidimicrobiales bacterium]